MHDADSSPNNARPAGRVRQLIAAVLVVLACVSLLVATPGVWARRNFLDTDRFVRRTVPLLDDPAVQASVTNRVTDDLMNIVEPARLLKEALPDRGQILAVPLANAIRGFVHDRVAIFIASDAFQTLWTSAVSAAHGTAIAVLNGDTSAINEQNGVVKLDLVPIINTILAGINAATPDVLGRDVTIPPIDAGVASREQVAKLATALNIDLPQDFGQLPVYERNQLSAAQEALHLFDRMVVIAVLATIVFAAAAIIVSRRRRRTIIYLAGGVMLVMILLRRAAFLLEDNVAAVPPTADGATVARALYEAFVDPLTTFAAWAALVALIAVGIALVTSGDARAVTLRANTLEFTREHTSLLASGGLLVAVAVLWAADLSWLGLLLLIVAVAAYEVAIHSIARTPAHKPGQPVAS